MLRGAGATVAGGPGIAGARVGWRSLAGRGLPGRGWGGDPWRAGGLPGAVGLPARRGIAGARVAPRATDRPRAAIAGAERGVARATATLGHGSRAAGLDPLEKLVAPPRGHRARRALLVELEPVGRGGVEQRLALLGLARDL